MDSQLAIGIGRAVPPGHLVKGPETLQDPQAVDALPGRCLVPHDGADRRDDIFTPARVLEELVGRRDPHGQVGVAEVGDQLLESRIWSDRSPRGQGAVFRSGPR